MYIIIYYEITMKDEKKAITVRKVESTILPKKKYALAYAYNKYDLTGQIKTGKVTILGKHYAQYYDYKFCIISKYDFGSIVNNKIVRGSVLDYTIREAIEKMSVREIKDASVELSNMVPEYHLYLHNLNNKNSRKYVLVTEGIIGESFLVYGTLVYKQWSLISDKFEFIIGRDMNEIDDEDRMFSRDSYFFAKPVKRR